MEYSSGSQFLERSPLTRFSESSMSSSSGIQWESVANSLKRNELVNLRLAWHNSCALPSNRALAKALRSNTSLRFISIGWHWQSQHKGREGLFQLLVTLAESIRPQQLQGIQLILNDAIPANVLLKFLQSQTCLSMIDIQLVSVQNSVWKGLEEKPSSSSDSVRSDDSTDSWITSSLRSNTSSSSTKSKKSSWRFGRKKVDNVGHIVPRKKERKSTVVPILMDTLLNHHQYNVLSELHLVDCDVNDDTALMLAQDLIPTSFLSLRGNRKLTGHGAAVLIKKLKATRRLDLSLCDFGANDCVLIAQAFRDRLKTSSVPYKLQQLSFCGNYRMELGGLAEMMQICPLIAHTLDLSYCDLSETMTVHILQRLIDLGQEQLEKDLFSSSSAAPSTVYRPVQLRELMMRGCRPCSADATRALTTLLHQNAPPLRRLALNDDKNDKKYMSANQLNQIADAMTQNYEMEQLAVDFFKGSKYEIEAWTKVEYWQRLNRAGRRLLVAISQGGAVDMSQAVRMDMDQWINLLTNVKAEADLESIYWVVRNSVERFRR